MPIEGPYQEQQPQSAAQIVICSLPLSTKLNHRTDQFGVDPQTGAHSINLHELPHGTMTGLPGGALLNEPPRHLLTDY